MLFYIVNWFMRISFINFPRYISRLWKVYKRDLKYFNGSILTVERNNTWWIDARKLQWSVDKVELLSTVKKIIKNLSFINHEKLKYGTQFENFVFDKKLHKLDSCIKNHSLIYCFSGDRMKWSRMNRYKKNSNTDAMSLNFVFDITKIFDSKSHLLDMTTWFDS